MRIGLVASPFISVPPPAYGGTELFVANLAEALIRQGVQVTVYANGESTVKADLRARYPRQDWPLSSEDSGLTKELDHCAWAIDHAETYCDVVHVSSALAVPFSRFSSLPFVCTLHHPYESALTSLYERNRKVRYVAISMHQASLHPTLRPEVIPHGLDLTKYALQTRKEPYLAFLGRICPIKGPHHAIAIAKRAGMKLKIAGEVQPIFQAYFDSQIRPHIDGNNVEFIGEANLATKNELLGSASALLFPIEWEEPFGLVMIEAMACGTPVIAFSGGAVREVVEDGITGMVCKNVTTAAATIRRASFDPIAIRRVAEKRFSVEAMARQYLRLYGESPNVAPIRETSEPTETAA